MKQQGPNVRKLIASRMSVLMIPAGTTDPLAAGVRALTQPGNVLAVCKEATAWVEEAIAAVKASPTNPYGDDDEAIAGDILRVADLKRKQRGAPHAAGDHRA